MVAIMLEAANTFEMSMNFYQTMQHNNLEDSRLHTCSHENLKSHLVLKVLGGQIIHHNHHLHFILLPETS
jgi:hypothetical protein